MDSLSSAAESDRYPLATETFKIFISAAKPNAQKPAKEFKHFNIKYSDGMIEGATWSRGSVTDPVIELSKKFTWGEKALWKDHQNSSQISGTTFSSKLPLLQVIDPSDYPDFYDQLFNDSYNYYSSSIYKDVAADLKCVQSCTRAYGLFSEYCRGIPEPRARAVCWAAAGEYGICLASC